MKKVLIFGVAILMTGCLSAGALELGSSKFELEVEALKSSGNDYLESPDFLAQEEAFDIDAGGDKSIYEYEYKSPKKTWRPHIFSGWRRACTWIRFCRASAFRRSGGTANMARC